MAKFSDDRFEIGASRVPALVLGQTKFSTNERERQKTIHAQQGIPTIESDFGKDAKKRGNYLEAGVTEWARDELEVMADGKADRNLAELRLQRNILLSETDYLALSDVTMSDAWKTYRQKLRDITKTFKSMSDKDFKFPTKPTE